MRIVLFTMDRLVEFMLPSQVFGTFAFDSNDDEKKLYHCPFRTFGIGFYIIILSDRVLFFLLDVHPEYNRYG